jgi:hypothetical protein
MDAVKNFATPENVAILLGVLFGISEALGAIPALKANGIFQAVFNVLKKLAGK